METLAAYAKNHSGLLIPIYLAALAFGLVGCGAVVKDAKLVWNNPNPNPTPSTAVWDQAKWDQNNKWAP